MSIFSSFKKLFKHNTSSTSTVDIKFKLGDMILSELGAPLCRESNCTKPCVYCIDHPYRLGEHEHRQYHVTCRHCGRRDLFHVNEMKPFPHISDRDMKNLNEI